MSESFKNSFNSRYSTYYVDQFIGLRCAGDLLNLGLFPNAKEITESFGMFEATRHLYPDIQHEDPDIVCIVVGDGTRPRTAALFAYLTKWTCISIDPELKEGKNDGAMERVFPIKSRVEDVTPTEFDSSLVIILPHSHAKIEDCLQLTSKQKRFIITLPCCVSHHLDMPIRKIYQDKYIWSPKKEITIWSG